jgi:hypothetical protein
MMKTTLLASVAIVIAGVGVAAAQAPNTQRDHAPAQRSMSAQDHRSPTAQTGSQTQSSRTQNSQPQRSESRQPDTQGSASSNERRDDNKTTGNSGQSNTAGRDRDSDSDKSAQSNDRDTTAQSNGRDTGTGRSTAGQSRDRDNERAAQSKDRDNDRAAQSRDNDRNRTNARSNEDRERNAAERDRNDRDRNAADRDRNDRDRQSTADRDRDRDNGHARVTLNSTQKTKVTKAFRDIDVKPVTNVNFSISVGTVVPSTIALHPVPEDVVAIVPQYRGYDFFVVRDQIVIVEPGTKRIVTVIDRGGSQASAEPSHERVRYTEKEREVIRKGVHRRTTTGATTTTTVTVGERLPDTVELHTFSPDVVRVVPSVRSYRYVDTPSGVYLVDPQQRTVIEEIQ